MTRNEAAEILENGLVGQASSMGAEALRFVEFFASKSPKAFAVVDLMFKAANGTGGTDEP